jgi:hypothetical protein
MPFDTGSNMVDAEAFKKAVKETTTERIVDRIVEVPKYKEVIVQKPKFVEKTISIDKPIYKEVEVERIRYIEKVVEVPKYIEKQIIVETVRVVEKIVVVEVPKYIEKIIEVPKYVTKEIIVEQVKLVPVEKKVELSFTVDKPIIKERDVVVDRPKYRELIVDVVKLHYKCQACGKEV